MESIELEQEGVRVKATVRGRRQMLSDLIHLRNRKKQSKRRTVANANKPLSLNSRTGVTKEGQLVERTGQ